MIAQRVECRPTNLEVVGSDPAGLLAFFILLSVIKTVIDTFIKIIIHREKKPSDYFFHYDLNPPRPLINREKDLAEQFVFVETFAKKVTPR